jgi:hypothetical protein
MKRIFNLEEAEAWFLTNSTGSVICVNEKGSELPCSSYIDAKVFFTQPEDMPSHQILKEGLN